MCYLSNVGSIDFFTDAMYRYHPQRFPIFDNYDLYAVKAQLNEYPPTPGEQICRGNFLSRFSILFKFRAHNNLRFTLLNISNSDGDIFSVVIDMISDSIIVAFADCRILQLDLPLGGRELNVGTWHRIGLAVDPGFIAVYKDCEVAYTYRLEHSCRVPCDRCLDIGVLEGQHDVILSHLVAHVSFLPKIIVLLCREQWMLHSFSTSQTSMPGNWHKLVLAYCAQL